MTIRSEFDFQRKLDEERIWRLKEIDALKKIGHRLPNGSLELQAFSRSALVTCYSHWEGFVKKSATLYLEFVSSRGLKANEIDSNLLSIKFCSILQSDVSSKRLDRFKPIIEFLRNDNSSISLPHKGMVNTESNLSSKVFIRILNYTGFDEKLFEDKFLFIDNELLRRRNLIAHGEDIPIGYSDLIAVGDTVLELLYRYKTELENAVSLKKFQC